MNPYYRVLKLFHKGIKPYVHPDEYFLVEVDKDNSLNRYKYKRFEKGAGRHLYDKYMNNRVILLTSAVQILKFNGFAGFGNFRQLPAYSAVEFFLQILK